MVLARLHLVKGVYHLREDVGCEKPEKISKGDYEKGCHSHRHPQDGHVDDSENAILCKIEASVGRTDPLSINLR